MSYVAELSGGVGRGRDLATGFSQAPLFVLHLRQSLRDVAVLLRVRQAKEGGSRIRFGMTGKAAEGPRRERAEIGCRRAELVEAVPFSYAEAKERPSTGSGRTEGRVCPGSRSAGF
jgi:hypothetical protein